MSYRYLFENMFCLTWSNIKIFYQKNFNKNTAIFASENGCERQQKKRARLESTGYLLSVLPKRLMLTTPIVCCYMKLYISYDTLA